MTLHRHSDGHLSLFDAPMPADEMERFASFSPCRRYRYALGRTWDFALKPVLFVGLNPSTADETLDDPTIRRCIRFARDWGYGGVLMGNLADDGTLWLNLGDSYAGSWGAQSRGGPPSESSTLQGNGHIGGGPKLKSISAVQIAAHPKGQTRTGSIPKGADYKAKDLLMIPALVALALRADGWYLRDEIIWHKPAPMPTSARDRTCRAHEVVYVLSKRKTYHYDQQAIAEPSVSDHDSGNGYARPEQLARGGRGQRGPWTREENPTRIKRSVWTVGTANFPEAHFATFPPKLVEPCILAGSETGDTILDPFAGAGTTGLVALRHDRSFVGVELNPDYARLARDRIIADAPLLNTASEAA